MKKTEVIINKIKGIDPGIKLLIFIFILCIPIINPMFRSDGIGYYAYIRSLTIDGDLQFRNEWEYGTKISLKAPAVFESDSLFVPKYTEAPEMNKITKTGYTPNRYSVGPAILWSPFFLLAHGIVKILNAIGSEIPAVGYSLPYLWLVAFGSAFYAFLGLILCYKIATNYFSRKVVLFSIIVIWFSSSLIAYMYGHPILSHSVSFFSVSLFLYYWHKRKNILTLKNWLLLGFLAGFMSFAIRPNNLLFASIPFLFYFFSHLKTKNLRVFILNIFKRILVFFIGFSVSLLPTLIVSKILYNQYLLNFYNAAGFSEYFKMVFYSPAFLKVLFSSMHGIFTWTPIIFISFIGSFLFARKDRTFGYFLILLFLLQVYYYGCLSNNWEQGSSFGARAFINFTPLYILGLSALVNKIKDTINKKIILILGIIFVLWNFGFLIQFGLGIIPRWDYINWSNMVYNQFFTIPKFIVFKISSLGILNILLLLFVCLTLFSSLIIYKKKITNYFKGI